MATAERDLIRTRPALIHHTEIVVHRMASVARRLRTAEMGVKVASDSVPLQALRK